MAESRMLRGIHGPKRMKVTGGWRKITRGVLTCSYSSLDVRKFKSSRT
jgi:hypothetical protein